jgi:hypothetical protein
MLILREFLKTIDLVNVVTVAVCAGFVVIFLRGLGRRSVRCVACHFDLRHVAAAGSSLGRCPECGNDLDRRGGTVVRGGSRRPGWAVLAVLAAGGVYFRAPLVRMWEDRYALMPAWLFVAMRDGGGIRGDHQALGVREGVRRLRNGRLPDAWTRGLAADRLAELRVAREAGVRAPIDGFADACVDRLIATWNPETADSLGLLGAFDAVPLLETLPLGGDGIVRLQPSGGGPWAGVIGAITAEPLWVAVNGRELELERLGTGPWAPWRVRGLPEILGEAQIDIAFEVRLGAEVGLRVRRAVEKLGPGWESPELRADLRDRLVAQFAGMRLDCDAEWLTAVAFVTSGPPVFGVFEVLTDRGWRRLDPWRAERLEDLAELLRVDLSDGAEPVSGGAPSPPDSVRFRLVALLSVDRQIGIIDRLELPDPLEFDGPGIDRE